MSIIITSPTTIPATDDAVRDWPVCAVPVCAVPVWSATNRFTQIQENWTDII